MLLQIIRQRPLKNVIQSSTNSFNCKLRSIFRQLLFNCFSWKSSSQFTNLVYCPLLVHVTIWAEARLWSYTVYLKTCDHQQSSILKMAANNIRHRRPSSVLLVEVWIWSPVDHRALSSHSQLITYKLYAFISRRMQTGRLHRTKSYSRLYLFFLYRGTRSSL